MPDEIVKAKLVVDDKEARKTLDQFAKDEEKRLKEAQKAEEKRQRDADKAAKEEERRQKKQAQDLEKLGKQMAIFGTAITAGMGLAVKATLDYNAELDNLHKRTGVAVEDLASLGYAAQMEDADIGTLADGLKYLARNADEAARGNKAAADAFSRAGIQIRDADGNVRPVRDLMLDLADAMARTDNDAQKTALAMDLLGRSGTELVPMLSMGKSELANLADEAQRLGIVTDEQTVAAWDKLDDQMVRTKMALQGAKQQIANELLPVTLDLAEAVQGAATSFTDLPESAKAFISVGTAATGTSALLAGSVMGLIGWMKNLKKTLELSSMATFGWIAAVVALIGVIAGVVAAVHRANEETRQHNAELGELLKTDGDLIDSMEKHNKLTNDQADAIARIGELFPQFVTKWDEHGRAIELDTQRLKDYNSQLDQAAQKEAALRTEAARRELAQLQADNANYSEDKTVAAKLAANAGTGDVAPGAMKVTESVARSQAQAEAARRAARIRYLESILAGDTTATNPDSDNNPPPYSGGGGGSSKELDAVERLNLALEIREEEYNLAIRSQGLAEDSAAALALRQQMLGDQLTIQAQKVNVLKAEYDKLVRTQGASADASQEMYLKLLQETSAFRDLQNQIIAAKQAETAGMTPEQEAKYNLIKSQLGSGNPIVGDPDEWTQRVKDAVGGQENYDEGVTAWAKLNNITGGIEAEASYFQHVADMINNGQLALPKYHSGGRNTTGAEQLAIIKNDETVLPAGVSPVQMTVNVMGNSFGAGVDPYGFGGQLARGMIDEMRVRGVKIGGR